MAKFPGLFLLLFIFGTGGAGCVQRTLTVRSNPSGALVYLNDQEIGRTPVTRNFLWYGVYDLEIRLPGYQSLKSTAQVIAPWWQLVPLDFVAEFLPLTDHHDLMFTLRAPTEEQEAPDLLVRRGEALRSQLLSTERPPGSTTRPAHHKKGATTRPKKSAGK